MSTLNQNRAETAKRALSAYTDEDPATNATDLITDLMHLLGRTVVEDAFRFAGMHFEAEKELAR